MKNDISQEWGFGKVFWNCFPRNFEIIIFSPEDLRLLKNIVF